MSIESNAAKELARIKALIPVIEAFLKGEEVEYKFHGFTTWTEADDPLWIKDCEYRIKPKPMECYAVKGKESRVTYGYFETEKAATNFVAGNKGLRIIKMVEEL